MREVKHYFVGTLGIADYYSASLYEQQVLALLDNLFQTHDYALLYHHRIPWKIIVYHRVTELHIKTFTTYLR